MKKFFVGVVILLFSSINYCFALANGIITFNLQPEFGFMHGSISEYVFEDACKNTDHMESRLDWDLQAVPYFKGTGDITIMNIVRINLNGKFAIPGSSGNMQDYDWLNSVEPKWMNQDPTELTNYSKHDNFLNNYYDFSIGLGGIIPIKDYVFITPMAAYEYSYIKFTGSNGYSKYKSNNFKEQKFSGTVITYEQETNLAKFGLTAECSPISQLYLYSDFFFSPGLTYINALDCHYLTSSGYLDKMEDGTLIQASVSAYYTFDDYNKLGIKCNFENLSLMKGKNYMKGLTKTKEPDSKQKWDNTKALGGTSHYIWNWSIVYSFNF